MLSLHFGFYDANMTLASFPASPFSLFGMDVHTLTCLCLSVPPFGFEELTCSLGTSLI